MINYQINTICNAMFMHRSISSQVCDLPRSRVRLALVVPECGNTGTRMYRRVEQMNSRIRRAYGHK